MENLEPEENCEFEESNGVYIIEDIYESLSEDKKEILSHLKVSDDKMNELKIENKNKFNKLKLLLYQKFLNILFSIMSSNIRKDLRIFFEKTKIFKLKNLGYNVEVNNKVRRRKIIFYLNKYLNFNFFFFSFFTKFKCPDFYLKSLMKHLDRKERQQVIRLKYDIFNLNRATKILRN